MLVQSHGESDNRSYTANDAATANSILRAALGLGPEQFGTEQFVQMISDEIEQLRATKSDAEIAQLLSDGGGIELSPDAIARFYAAPETRRRPS